MYYTLSTIHINLKIIWMINITKKPVKYLRIKIGWNWVISVTAPLKASDQLIKDFIESKKERIATCLSKIKLQEPAFHYSQEEVKKLQQEAKVYLTARTNQLATRFGISYNRLFIRDQKTKRWTCSSLRNIWLNRKLIKLPKHLIDYVICHEFAHLKHMNHSRDFWNRVWELYPEWDEASKELKKFGGSIS